METLQIDILNPKARKLLKDLSDLNLIAIRESTDDDFLALVNKLRSKAKKAPPTLDEITKEVEVVRAERYVNNLFH
jgi:hypothetical protein